MKSEDSLTRNGTRVTLLLAHGAGAPCDSPFMERLSAELGVQGIDVVRFEFPYMQARRADGRRRPPDRLPRLLAHFRDRIEEAGKCPGPLFIGGKSMGGRIASMLATEAGIVDRIAGVVCFGYPFHPPGKLQSWRSAHFGDFRIPVCIIQGTRDRLGRPEDVEDHPEVRAHARLYWLDGGDHDYVTLKRHPRCQEDLIQQAATLAADFMSEIG